MEHFAFFIFQLIVLILSVMVHEVSHGVVAERLGDPTARLAGRITMNPLKHIDPFGSIILPLLLSIPALFGQPAIILGWAKPVPYNPALLKNPKLAAGKIAIAGPISNILLAIAFGILLRFLGVPSGLALLFQVIIYVNVLLAVFNLVPFPPLDGSKVLFALLPRKEWAYNLMGFLERYGFFLIIAFVFFGFETILPIIRALFILIAGIPFGTI